MSKRKTPKTLQKPLPIVDTNISSAENALQFELELYWCVQQLEQSLNSGKLTQKIADETTRNMKTLKSSTVPLIRKRQLMKNLFGDYRSKMKDDEKKHNLTAKQIKFSNPVQPKSSFVKKSAILTPGKDFRFNFDPNLDNNATETKAEKNDENLTKKLTLNSGQDFKFNFSIDTDEENIDLNKLSIKN